MLAEVTAAIIAATKVREYSRPETLAVLTVAIDEGWLAIPAGFLDGYDAVRASAHSTADPWLNLAMMRGLPTTQWQAYKDRLYAHIDQAAALYDGTPLEDAMTPEQAQKALDQLAALTTAVAKLATDVAQIKADTGDTRVQLRGPNDAGWRQLGKNNRGENLSFIDALGRVKDKLFGTNNAVS